MKFNKNHKPVNNQKVQKKRVQQTEEVEDTHHEDMLKGVEKKFSVFNRKQNRKIKKVEKKQKKQTFFSSTKEEKKQIMYDKLQKENEEKYIKQMKEQQKKEQQQQKPQVDKEEQKRIKLERIEKQRAEREKRLLEEKIKLDAEEVEYFEKMLGKTKGKQGERKFKKEFLNDGWDEDLFSFLENISTTIKKDVKEYKPFFEKEGILEDEEINKLVEQSNAPITLVNGKKSKNQAQQPNNEDEEENPDQEGFTDEEEQDMSEIDEEESNEDIEDEEEEEEGSNEEMEEEDEEEIDEEDNEMELDDEDGENELQYDEDEEDDDDNEDEDENEEYEYVEEFEEEKPQKKEIKSILKGSNNQENKLQEKTQKQIKDEKKTTQNSEGEKKELSEIEKWRLEKQQKKEQGMTEEEKERKRILEELEKKDFEKKNLIRKSIIQGYNRLSETNIDIIFKEILENFQSNAKNLVTPILGDIFMKTTIEQIKVMQHIMASNTVVISAIHQIYDNECFAPIMKGLLNLYQEIIQNKQALDAELEEDSINEDSLFNKLRNITIIFSYFYIFDDVSIDFISGFLEHLLQNINQRTVEALLILVQHVGAKIRQDNPQILKNVIDNTKKAVDQYSAKLIAEGKTVPKKIEFVMLTLNDIRLNKKLKADPIQRLSFFINWLKKNVIQKMKLTAKTFPVDFKYAYNSKRDTPRWYSQFETGAYRHDQGDLNEGEENQDNDFSHLNEETKRKLEQLAIKCRMTTDTRKRIFMLVMSSEDYVDAAQRILKLKIVKKQSQEIAVVIIQCCAQEQKFNPFYVYLTQKLIEINPKIKFTFQYALWDQFKLIERAEIRKINNLAKYISLLCSTKSLGITALKFFDLDNLSEQTIIFLKIFLGSFFKKISQEDLEYQLSKAVAREENFVFVEGFKDFLKNYYWKSILTGKEKDNEALKETVKYTVKKLKIQPKADKFED